MSKKTGGLLFVTLVLPLALFIIGAWQYQNISDFLRLVDYEPSPRIAEIRNDIRLTDQGEKLFYVHDPQVVDSSNFNMSCPVYEETIVLGCYFTNSSIYIFDVEDSRPELQGVEEVTAAHELLHAAYDRLTTSEKKWLDDLLTNVYNSLPQDSPIRKNIDEYRKQGEDVVKNELHSIIGTEVAEIPDELENYYARYFEDRSVIVSIAQSYSDVFRSLEKQIESYDSTLQRLSQEISDLENSITSRRVQLDNLAAQLDKLRESPNLYNQKVGEYNSLVRSYNTTVEEYKETINEYNEIVKKRNEISAEQRTLYDAIDARAEEVEE